MRSIGSRGNNGALNGLYSPELLGRVDILQMERRSPSPTKYKRFHALLRREQQSLFPTVSFPVFEPRNPTLFCQLCTGIMRRHPRRFPSTRNLHIHNRRTSLSK